MNKELLVHHINKVLDMYLDNERVHYVEAGKPSDHIYIYLMALQHYVHNINEDGENK
jgi:hypothetical protein